MKAQLSAVIVRFFKSEGSRGLAKRARAACALAFCKVVRATFRPCPKSNGRSDPNVRIKATARPFSHTFGTQAPHKILVRNARNGV